MFQAVILAAAAFAASGPQSFLGIELGKPLALKECKFNDYQTFQSYESYASGCFRHDRKKNPGEPLSDNEVVLVTLPEAPDGFDRQDLMVHIVGGNVEVVSIRTFGLAVQAKVAAALVEKYGPATEAKELDNTNGFGARFKSVQSTWTFDNLTVDYFGVSQTMRSGAVLVTTPVGMKYLDERQKEKDAGKPKL